MWFLFDSLILLDVLVEVLFLCGSEATFNSLPVPFNQPRTTETLGTVFASVGGLHMPVQGILPCEPPVALAIRVAYFATVWLCRVVLRAWHVDGVSFEREESKDGG